MGELSLTVIARELLQINEIISFYINNPSKTRISDFEMETFVQTWGSTTCGFGGIGGSAMTSQRTYVFIPYYTEIEKCLVFFGSRFAYKADYCEKFKEDLRKGNLVSVNEKGKYINKGEDK